MNKFEKVMIGHKKFPDLVYTRVEKVVAWISAIMIIGTPIGVLGGVIYAVLQ
ncbi:hypothetical protein LCGC14_2543330, partial [marine sediment metagenome]